MMVVAADRGGSVRESVAVAQGLRRGARAPRRRVHERPARHAAGDRRAAARSADDLHDAGDRALREAIAILERVATEDEVVEYKRFVFALAESVARAHKEGGFLGIGGKEVSEREQAALDEIAAIFDEEPPPAAA